MERYPESIDISIDDFRNSNWLAAITDSSREDYSSIWQSLSSAARQAIEDKKLEEGKILWLLADACSMMLRPASLNEPFKPMCSLTYDVFRMIVCNKNISVYLS